MSERSADDMYPLLVGTVRLDGQSLLLSGPYGQLRLAPEDPKHWLALLGHFDGQTPLAELISKSEVPEAEALRFANALTDAGLLTNARRRWSEFFRASSNPMPLAARVPTATESIPRWKPPVSSPRSSIDPSALRVEETEFVRVSRTRRSMDRKHDPRVDAVASENAALKLAHASYSVTDGCRRPVASAGGLEPIQLVVIGTHDDQTQSRLLVIEDDGQECVELGRVTRLDVRDWLVADGSVEHFVEAGAALIVVCADPTRSVAKYGERGWRYILMEAGAVAHHISLLAADLGVSCRPIGGFYDRALGDALPGLLPLLCVLLVVPAVH